MTPERLQRIEELFLYASDLPEAERTAFLDAECAGDGDLRREIEFLLREEDATEAPFATLIMDAAESLADGDREALAGRRVGAYRITKPIGQGGMAEVFLAVRDDDQYQQSVAVKLIRRGMVTSAMLTRFRHERQILASLNHPNIARLLDGGTTGDGLPYFVMEYIDGQPITSYCDERRLSVKQRLRLFRAVCGAVQHAHRNLIVHRDLKPSNILVTEDGAPKLLDFGIAKLLSPSMSATALTLAQTAPSVRLMTPHYASPEQVRGEPVTTATDVYALGAVLYELLTGATPHRFRDGSFTEIERVICEQEIERPSAAVKQPEAPARLRRELKGDLDNIVLMALRKESERRYQSVEQLSEDIRRYLEGRPVQARTDALGYRAGKFIRRHKAGVAAAALFVVLLGGFTVMTSLQAARIARERDRANLVTEFLVGLFEVSNPSQARGNEITAREILDKGADRIDRELAGQPETQAAMMNTIGRVYSSLGLYDSARPLLERALEIRRATLGSRHADVADSLQSLAALEAADGKYPEAEVLYREALALRIDLFGTGHVKVGEIRNDLGELLRLEGRLDEAEQMHREALALRRELLGPEHIDVAYSLNNLATVLDDKGDYAAAESFHREALDIKRRTLGPEHPSVANTLNNLALVRANLGDLAGAEALHREALALRRKVLGPMHPDLAVTINNLASTLRDQKKLDEAEQLFREALDMKRKLLGPDHPSVAAGLQNLADVLEAREAYDQADPLYVEALAISKKAFAPDHWRLAAVRSSYGSCLTKMGRLKEAESMLLAAHEALKTALGPDNRRTVQTAGRLATLYDAMGRPDEAARYRTGVTQP